MTRSMTRPLNHRRFGASADSRRVPYKPLSLFRFVILSEAEGGEAKDLAAAFAVYFQLLTINGQLASSQ